VEVEPTKYLVQGKKVVTSPPPAWRGLRIDYATGVRPLDSLPKHAYEAVAVADVEKASAAWDAGLRPGMFISQVASTAVRTPKDFRQAVARQTGRVSLRILADEEPQKAQWIDVGP
jgi:S1-C subfamily serine protease